MKLALLLVPLALLAAACGSAPEPAAQGGSTAAVSVDKTSPESATRPPAILLESVAGTQRATPGSSCVDKVSAGVEVCADPAVPLAERLSIVHPGETVTIRLANARAVRNESCHARDQSCIGEADVTAFGCPAVRVGRVFLERGSGTQWTVPLGAGVYELQVFVYFETDDGRAGDASGSLGLRVDPSAKQTIVPAGTPPIACR